MVCAKYKQWSGTNITVGIVDYIHYGKVRKVAFSCATSWSSFVIFFLFFLKDVHIYLLLLIIFMYSQFSILFGCKLYKLLPPPASIDFIGIWLFILLKVCYFVYPMNTSGQFKIRVFCTLRKSDTMQLVTPVNNFINIHIPLEPGSR